MGKCSLTVALPVISSMGIETAILPTAVLSTHTAFTGFTFRDLTSDLNAIAEHWKNQQIRFDAVYTGYLGSLEQISIVSNFIQDFTKNGALSIVDPAMGDNGKLYKGFDERFALKMAELCGQANIITPNMTEACFLLGEPCIASGYTEDYVKNLCIKLAALGAQKIVLKGVEFNEDSSSGTFRGIKGKIGVVTYDSEKDRFSWYFHKKIDQSFHGTGDIFASVVTGALMRDLPLENAVSLASDFVVESIKATLSHPDYNWYGVDFENAIPYLLKRLNK